MTRENRPTSPSVRQISRIPASPSSLLSPSQMLPAKRAKVPKPKVPNTQRPRTPPRKRRSGPASETTAELSSPARQTDLFQYSTPTKKPPGREQQIAKPSQADPSRPRPVLESLDMTGSPSRTKIQRSLQVLRQTGPERPNPPLSQGTVQPNPEPPTVAELKRNEFKQPPSFSLTHTSLSFSQSAIDKTILRANPGKRNVIRVRESLQGAFAIEEVDLTNDVGKTKAMSAKERRLFRGSEVSVLDLTGD